MNKEVSFPVAKLLKEKRQNIINSKLMYASNGELTDAVYDFDDWCFAPTIAEVVMWLYEKHGIWVYPRPVLDEDGEWIFKGYIKLMANFKAKEIQTKLLRQPTEAYEAAIEYTLTKLI